MRAGGRWRFARYWSLFASAVIDLTNRNEDPLTLADGFEPVRHRLGILYDDECIELGVTRGGLAETTGDARRGNTFLIRVALRNLGHKAVGRGMAAHRPERIAQKWVHFSGTRAKLRFSKAWAG